MRHVSISVSIAIVSVVAGEFCDASERRLPWIFEANQGQWPGHVRFAARQGGHTVLLAATAITGPVELRFANANPEVAVTGGRPQDGRANYLVGNEAARWVTDVPTFDRVQWRNLYPGIDMVCYGRDGRLEYDLVISPGARIDAIALDLRGAGSVVLDEHGRLSATGAAAGLLQPVPTCYQERGSQRDAVAGRYVRRADGLIGFQVGPHDPDCALVIDPVLLYASYLGGSGYDETRAVAVDDSGNVYVAGYTLSTNLPTSNPYQASLRGIGDAYVMKFSAGATSLVYATYLGGSDDDEARGLAVDGSGQAVVCGATSSTDFPTKSPFQAANGGSQDAFIAKLGAAGNSLVYASYLGGNSSDIAYGVAVNRTSGEAWITGDAASSNFPTSSGWAHKPNGYSDIFIARLTASGTRSYVTCVGGTDDDVGYAIALDGSSMPYVFGETQSTNVTGTTNSFQARLSGSIDGLVVHLHGGTTLGYATYLGGTDIEYGRAIAVDAASNAVVAGTTYSSDFPTRNAFQSAKSGGRDGFIAKVLPSGTGVVFSTYLGGSGSDTVQGLAADSTGGVWAVGATDSANFPTRLPVQASRAGAYGDAFVARLAASGTNLQFSTYLGGAVGASGSAYSQGLAVAPAADGSVYVAGNTVCTDFPVESAFAGQFGGTMDGFLARYGDVGTPALMATAVSNGALVVTWKSYTGATYNVESVPALGTTNWVPVPASTNLGGRRNRMSISDTPGAATSRFYRVNGSAP